MKGGGCREDDRVVEMVKDGEEEHMGEELMKDEEEKNEGMMKRERRACGSLKWQEKERVGVTF